MYPINNIDGIIQQEEKLEGSHVIVLMFVKPSDKNAEEYTKNFNYWHQKSNTYCSIYLIGYSQNFSGKYQDVKTVDGINNQKYEYSDKCFSEVCDALNIRLTRWQYSGEPELIILQNSSAEKSGVTFDFSHYNYIDINYGIEKGYLDSFPRFMERFLNACKQEVFAGNAVSRANRQRLKPRRIVETALELCPKLPTAVKLILNDRIFYKSSNSGNRK